MSDSPNEPRPDYLSQPSNYPREGVYGDGRNYKPYIDWEVISEAFRLMWPKFGTWFAAGALVLVFAMMFMIAGFAAYVAVTGFNFEAFLEMSFTDQMILNAVIYGVGVIAYALLAPLLGGFCLMALKARRGQPYGLSDFFQPMARFFDFAVAGFTIYLMIMIGTICCYFPAFIVGGMTMFVFPCMVDKGYSFGEALSYSFDQLKQHWLMATLIYVVASLVASLGAVACIIGVCFTLPMLSVIASLLYDNFIVPEGRVIGAYDQPAGFS